MTCPKCQGGDVRSFSVLYDEGRTNTTGSTVGKALGVSKAGISIGVGKSESAGYAVSELARRLAPPEREQFSTAGFFDKAGRQRDEEQFRDAFDRWRHMHLCLQCDTELLIAVGSSPTIIPRDIDPVLDAHIRAGRMLLAVKHLVDSRGLALADAKNVVDARKRKL